MLVVDASLWGDWDEMFKYIRQFKDKCKITIVNASYLLEVMYGEELRELGFIK
ncbi:hypothetical protein [Paenibacillus sp. NAIST15-1]|uniref:hypothetical protein n=1 Tax=Paenibacillus sp. NAIST15-1 TaxID=1605994 RepID=UPI00086D645C|nr:hypothetical protein [Paenibacillus sp. NAIST15-1]GAV11312.1 hypothetical protein PBN151_1239 [Paenibacillus sp. NAIST15-1]